MTDNTELPAPLVPPEVDLRGYEFMPYYGDRLRDSDLNSRATDAEYRAAHNLWWSSWKQVPAASLPDDDTVLGRLADLGRDVKTWRTVRDVALRGFVKCSDGRFYHRVLGPLAIEAYEFRNSQRDRTEKARKAKQLQRQLQNERPPDKPPVTDSTGQDRTGQDSKSSATRASPKVEIQTPDAVAHVVGWLKAQGLKGVNASDNRIAQIAQEGVTEQIIIEAVRTARIDRGKGDGALHFAYVLGIITDLMHPIERKPPDAWWLDDAKTMAKAKEFGVTTYGKHRDQLRAEINDAIARKNRDVPRGTKAATSPVSRAEPPIDGDSGWAPGPELPAGFLQEIGK